MVKSIASNTISGKEASKGSLKELLPYGMLATKKWLTKQGMSTHSIDNAVKSKKLLILAVGVYSQYTRAIRWEGAVASMQYMGVNGKTTLPPMLVGGLSALSLSGLSHYLILGDAPRISLYAPDKLPKWIERLSLTANFDAHSTAKLWPVEVMQNEAYVKRYKWDQELPPVYFSCPEKAILEVLLDVPNFTSFEHADELMQGLVNLSPKKLDELLKACKSVKVKRLFFWLAKRQQYSWFEKLEEKNYDLGSGKRIVAKKGKLDNDYLITVPSHMVIKDD